MYEELVKLLREPCQYENCVLCQEAADAIEDMNRSIDGLEADNESLCQKIEELSRQLAEYHKYDTFLYAHGFFREPPKEKE